MPFNRFRHELEDPLRRVIAAVAVTLGTGVGAWLADGGLLRIALAAVALLALILLAATLLGSGIWQSKELQENAYTKARDDDARQRRLVRAERANTKLLTDAREGKFDPATTRSKLQGCLEQQRAVLAGEAAAPVNLLVVEIDAQTERCTVVYDAGKFDSTVLRTSIGAVDDLIVDLSDGAEDTASYWAPLRVDRRSHRLIVFSSGEIGEHVRAATHRAATVFQELAQILSDRERGVGSDEAEAT